MTRDEEQAHIERIMELANELQSEYSKYVNMSNKTTPSLVKAEANVAYFKDFGKSFVQRASQKLRESTAMKALATAKAIAAEKQAQLRDTKDKLVAKKDDLKQKAVDAKDAVKDIPNRAKNIARGAALMMATSIVNKLAEDRSYENLPDATKERIGKPVKRSWKSVIKGSLTKAGLIRSEQTQDQTRDAVKENDLSKDELQNKLQAKQAVKPVPTLDEVIQDRLQAKQGLKLPKVNVTYQEHEASSKAMGKDLNGNYLDASDYAAAFDELAGHEISKSIVQVLNENDIERGYHSKTGLAVLRNVAHANGMKLVDMTAMDAQTALINQSRKIPGLNVEVELPPVAQQLSSERDLDGDTYEIQKKLAGKFKTTEKTTSNRGLDNTAEIQKKLAGKFKTDDNVKQAEPKKSNIINLADRKKTKTLSDDKMLLKRAAMLHALTEMATHKSGQKIPKSAERYVKDFDQVVGKGEYQTRSNKHDASTQSKLFNKYLLDQAVELGMDRDKLTSMQAKRQEKSQRVTDKLTQMNTKTKSEGAERDGGRQMGETRPGSGRH